MGLEIERLSGNTLSFSVLKFRGGSRISGKRFHMGGGGMHFAEFISFFFSIP